MDYRVNIDDNPKNTVIYGHNIKNGSMFGSLKKILNKDWYENEENLQITYIDENGLHIYQIFSIYQIEKETYFSTTYFSSDDEFEEFISTLKGRSITNFDVDVTSADNILTLSTCASNNAYRVILHAKKLS